MDFDMRIKKRDLRMFLLTIPVVKPMSMSFFSLTNNLYLVASLLTFCYILMDMLMAKLKMHLITKLVIALEMIVLLASIVNGGPLRDTILSVIGLSYIALLINWSVEKKFAGTLIKSMVFQLELCTYINFLTLILRPEGFFSRSIAAYGRTQEWFLGSDHYFVVWAIPAFLIAMIYKDLFGDSKRSYCLVAFTVLTQFISGSSTGLVGVIIFLIWLVVPVLRKIITPTKSIILAVFLFITIVYMQQSDFLEPIIVDLLGKDMTYTNRLEIWNNAISAIGKSPFFGYGILTNKNIVDLLGQLNNGFRWEGATHCHDQYLQIGLMSGLIGLGVYVGSIVHSFWHCRKCINKNISSAATVCLLIFCIISITEVYQYALMYMLFILPCYLDEISFQAKKDTVELQY